MSLFKKICLITSVIINIGCKANADDLFSATPPEDAVAACENQTWTSRIYKVFIPTPAGEFCPEPWMVFNEFRSNQYDFNEKYENSSHIIIENAFLEDFVGDAACIEIWQEKWATVKCDNQMAKCTGSCDAENVWFCDNAAIPAGVLPDSSGLPYYVWSETDFSCSVGLPGPPGSARIPGLIHIEIGD